MNFQNRNFYRSVVLNFFAVVVLVGALTLISMANFTSSAQAAGKPGSPTATPTPTDDPIGGGGGGGGTSWSLIWSDEFNSQAGTLPNSSNWVIETGNGDNGWGNQERQYYTNRPENVSHDGQGNLAITAKKEAYGSSSDCSYEYTPSQCEFTSGRIKTQDLQLFSTLNTAKKIEARIKIPGYSPANGLNQNQGIWPAFWMLGNDIPSVGWPSCGEIDILENIGSEPNIVHGTVHGPRYAGASGIGAPYSLSSGAFYDDYHVYGIEWEDNIIRWYVDGTLYNTLNATDLPKGTSWVFNDKDFFLLLNVAVGGAWPGDPIAPELTYTDRNRIGMFDNPNPSTYTNTAFSQTMLVDYVRVYER